MTDQPVPTGADDLAFEANHPHTGDCPLSYGANVERPDAGLMSAPGACVRCDQIRARAAVAERQNQDDFRHWVGDPEQVQRRRAAYLKRIVNDPFISDDDKRRFTDDELVAPADLSRRLHYQQAEVNRLIEGPPGQDRLMRPHPQLLAWVVGISDYLTDRRAVGGPQRRYRRRLFFWGEVLRWSEQSCRRRVVRLPDGGTRVEETPDVLLTRTRFGRKPVQKERSRLTNQRSA